MIAFLSLFGLIINISCSEYVIVNVHEAGLNVVQNCDEFKYFPNESSTILVYGETNDKDVSNNIGICFEPNKDTFGSNYVTTTDDNQSTILSELEEFLILRGSIRCPENHYYESPNVVLSVKNPFNIINFYEFVKELNDKITSYINIHLSDAYTDDNTYFKRLNYINKGFEIIEKYESDDYEEVFTSNIDQAFIDMLDILKLHYSDRLTFNYLDYECFSDDFDLLFDKIEQKKDLRGLEKILRDRPNQILKEFMHIYKYAKEIPELLYLGHISARGYYKKVTFFLHLISLFLTRNEDNLIKNRVLILFLMKKALKNTSKFSLDIIFTLQYQELITVDRSKLLFFSWEFIKSQRTNINNRLSCLNNPNLYFYENDRVHYNIVLRLFLFQHLLYLRYKNVQENELEEFKAFTKCVLQEKNGCFRSQFNRFIYMIH